MWVLAGASGSPAVRRHRGADGFCGGIIGPWAYKQTRDARRVARPGKLRLALAGRCCHVRQVSGSPKRRPAELGRRMIARRRRVGVLEPYVPEYLVDNRLIGDKRDDPHCPAASGAQQWIFLPDLPNELRPSHAPASAPLAFIAVGVIGRACRCLFSAARHPALSGGV